ncbi:MAG: osmoprotectant NAGGN system M42 family peptidase [Tepidamorphaceae bacterium]|nr:osmoprotectant NAGGN system M42 family peptidase [Rhodobiaceae bacterium]MCC0048438.1 osmoprotectant NAGGN system M42 family peptidase [Rhodobiaceae bacterium]
MTRLPVDTDYLLEQLRDLLAIPSPTGYTDSIVRHTANELKKLGLEIELTRRGAIRAYRKGRSRRPARAIVTHLDTLGAQVKSLKSNGRLELIPIGTWSARFAEGARVTIFSEKGTYRGTILSLKASGHTYNDEVDELPIGWRYVEVRVDARARDTADLVQLGIDVGDIVAVDPQPEMLENGFIVSRHLDNKAGVAVALTAIKALQQEDAKTPVDVYFLFSIAEEVGVGASALLNPEIAAMVAIDNGTSAPGQNSDEFGVTIAMGDETGPFDFHLTQKLVELCRENDIRMQKDVFRYYRSDSASAITAGHDVRTALITFGVDASHGYERIHLHALRSLAELVTAYLTSPVQIKRDKDETTPGLKGFTRQPEQEATGAGVLEDDSTRADAELDPEQPV